VPELYIHKIRYNLNQFVLDLTNYRTDSNSESKRLQLTSFSKYIQIVCANYIIDELYNLCTNNFRLIHRYFTTCTRFILGVTITINLIHFNMNLYINR